MTGATSVLPTSVGSAGSAGSAGSVEGSSPAQGRSPRPATGERRRHPLRPQPEPYVVDWQIDSS